MSGADYRNFEIHIRKQAADGTFPVTAWVPFEDRRAESVLSLPYADSEIDRAMDWMEQGLFDADYVKSFGARLFQAIFYGPIKDIYDGCRQSGAPLRFRLIIDAPRAARIPWELLYDPERKVFPSLEGPFVRGTCLTVATRPLEVRPPLRFQVQWFERNRLELHPEYAQPYDVLLGRLGADRLAQQGREWQSFAQSAAVNGCRYFPETGHNAWGEILAAWRASGLEFDGAAGKSEAENLALFGLPLSNPQTEVIEGKPYTVQWFERARFELHPEYDPPHNVLLGLLGNEIRAGGGPPTPTPPTPTEPTPTPTPTPTTTPTATPTEESSAGIPAQLDFYIPNVNCLLNLKVGASTSNGRAELASYFMICLEGFERNKEIAIRVLRPDGTELLAEQASMPPSGNGLWLGVVRLGEPLGKYTITARQAQRQAKGTITMEPATSPRLSVSPQAGAPGTRFRIRLAGYQNDQDRVVRLYLYRAGKYLTALPPAKIDQNGEASVSLATNLKYQPGEYIVVAEPVRISYCTCDLGIFTVSR